MPEAFDILNLSGEAAVCTRGSLIRFANAPARELLGQDCVGRSLRELFGEEVSEAQGAGFIADVSVGGRRCTARFSRIDKGWLIFLASAATDPAVLNMPLLFSLRSSLMNMGIVTDSLRNLAEDTDSVPLRHSAAALTSCYYRLMRQVENAGFVLNLLTRAAALNAVPTDLHSICAEAAEALQGFFPKLEITAKLEGGGRAVVDPALFKLLLSNLLSNALIHAGATQLRLRLSETPQSLILSLTDDGCGIPADKLALAFDRYRHSFSMGELGRGPGLGLSVARGVAELHGGTLLLESREGRGTAVRVSFSRNLAPGTQLCAEAEGPAFSSRDLLTGMADCLPEEAFSEKYLD